MDYAETRFDDWYDRRPDRIEQAIDDPSARWAVVVVAAASEAPE